MIENRTYCVANHRFVIRSHYGMLSEKELEQYAPFQADSFPDKDSCVEQILFSLSLSEEPEEFSTEGSGIVSLVDENGKITIRNKDEGMMICLTTASGHDVCRLRISNDYIEARGWIGGSEGERRYALDSALMLLYTFASSKHDTLMVHASAVEYEGNAYLFLGKSGTGKSTHSRLWKEHITGTKLINDDNPVVRITDGEVYVYGTPWSGKTRCYLNKRVELGGIVRLHQKPYNRITKLSPLQAYASLLPSCSGMKWDHSMSEALHATISKVIEKVESFSLDCRPDKAAAELCRNTLSHQKDYE